ncbi:MAG: hypothetical protein HC919_11610 [Oscillatoriales cyanobacterium SM2_2_1]|nr:hypothetical protein [Oscillatoriales cyanobacterium SM2_2_1]
MAIIIANLEGIMDRSSDSMEERFRQLEQEVATAISDSAPPKVAKGWQRLTIWVNGLTGTTKIAAVIMIGLAAFAVLNFLLKTVMAILSLAVMGVIAYILWQVFFASNKENT